MRTLVLIACLAAGLSGLSPAGAAASAPRPAAAIAAAIADPSRPPEDTARDADRKPAATLAFAEIKAGDVIVDHIANGGYFTRLFADAVGPRGHVYAVELNEIIGLANVTKGYQGLQTWAEARPNVTIMTQPAKEPLSFPRKIDVFWSSQNYHDLHDKWLGPVDVAAFNRQVFAALKPGGLYIVLDHVAAKGSPADVTETLHRIEPETVKREVEAAGFQLVGESAILANPADPHTKGVFDPSIRGRTDQFILKFRRPG